MLTVIRNDQGLLEAACEWWMVNDAGQQDWFCGTVVWVEQLELSSWVAPKRVIQQLIIRISEIVPQAKLAYWVRRDKTGNKVHAFTRTRLVKFSEEVIPHGRL